MLPRVLLLLIPLCAGCLYTEPVDDDDVTTDDDDTTADDDDDDSAIDDADGDGWTVEDGDCDDADPAISPGASEVCDDANVDEDCDGAADDADPQGADGTTTVYLDADGDDFGLSSAALMVCDPLPSQSTQDGDCDDGDPTRYPGAPRRCDGLDNDCDGVVTDAGLVTVELTGDTFTVIQDALDAAPLGQVVTVCDGTYVEALTIDRAVLLGSLSGRDTTILSPPGGAAVAISVTADSTLIDGFTVLGGGVGLAADGPLNLTVRSTSLKSSAVGPALDGANLAGLTLTDVHVLDSAGAGLVLADSAGLVQDLVARGSAGTGVAITDSTITLEDAVIEQNTASALAGGLAVTGGTVTVLDSEIRDNSAPSAGGVLVAGAMTWTDGELLRNASTAAGALGAVVVTSSITIDSVDGGTGVDDNSPADIEAGGQGWSIPSSGPVSCTALGCP